MSQILFTIKSPYNLKAIFAIVDYDRILKLINHNKKLQKSFGIDVTNYKERSNFQHISRPKFHKFYCGCGCCVIQTPTELLGKCLIKCFPITVSIILFTFLLIYASILASKGAFNENNTKDNYNKNYSKIIDKINLSLFGFLAYIFFSLILLFLFVQDRSEYDLGLTKIIKKIILFIIGILCLCYEIIIIFKLYLSYQIKKNKITWFMRCDYTLIIFIFLYLLVIIINTIDYFQNAGTKVQKEEKEEEKLYLIKFRGIEINDFFLSSFFINMNDYEKRKYILNNKNIYSVSISRSQKDLIALINKFRIENNIDELNYDIIITFNDLIFDRYSEPILHSNENIFKLSNEQYLLKYALNEFETRFNNKEKMITNILLNDYLNKIIIIEKDNIQFIFIYHAITNPTSQNNTERQSESIEIRRISNYYSYCCENEKKF